MSTSLLDLDPLVIPLIKGNRVVDVGCGFGHWGHLLMTHYRPDPTDPSSRARVTGIEMHEGNAELCRRAGTYDDVICGDAMDYLAAVSEHTFDTVMAIDVLEHLERAQGELFLDLLERAARERVIVSTPNFPNEREGSHGLTGYNPWESHLSAWSYKDFKARGYHVRGIRHHLHGRIYRIRGMYRLMTRWPFLHEILNVVTSRCCWGAHTVLAWKRVEVRI